MKNVETIYPSAVAGELVGQPSKSYTQRAYALAALAQGKSIIRNPSFSNDGNAALDIVRSMGAEVTIGPPDGPNWDEVAVGDVVIDPTGVSRKQAPKSAVWHAGEAGLSFRMFSAIAATLEYPITIKGKGSLATRPVDFVVDTLSSLGAKVQSRGNTPPVSIHGPLKPGEYVIDGSQSSQLISGLLIGMPLLKRSSLLTIENARSKPYLAMTLDMIHDFGVFINEHRYERFEIRGDQQYKGVDIEIEGDWSGIACFLVAGATAGSVTVKNATYASEQADRQMLNVLRGFGPQVLSGDDQVTVNKKMLLPITFDATHCPDLFPPLVALALSCKGTSRIRGIHRLKHKESDRFSTLQSEFQKLGAKIEADGDEMLITRTRLKGGKVDAHNDHRIAMALAVAALCADGPVEIHGADCVNKSYPSFFDDLRQITSKG